MEPPVTRFDHLVVAAATLDVGVAWVQDRLGVTVPFGGIHDHMGTHNCVGQLTPATFLEIIAINPDATPDRTRWFSMDDPVFHARVSAEGAFLHHWVINSTDINATLTAAKHNAGPAMNMSRGSLSWQISVRDDGHLPRDGILPTVIQWPDIPHPASRMDDLGLQLTDLKVHSSDPNETRRELIAMGADDFCSLHRGANNHLSATFIRDGWRIEL